MNALNCLKPRENCFSCVVELLNGTQLNLTYTASERGAVLQQKVWRHVDLLEKEYFSLRFINSQTSISYWLDGHKGVARQIKGVCDCDGLRLFMGVKFYTPHPNQLLEEITRYQFYLQLRRDVYSGTLTLPSAVLAQVSALAAQGELGDYTSDVEENGYPVELKLLRHSSAELDTAVAKIHQTLRGLDARECEARYLHLISKQEFYGIRFHRVKGSEEFEYKLSLSSDGIVIYKQNTKASLYLWRRIESIQHKKCDFSIQVYNKKRTELLTMLLTCANKTECKQLWKLAVEHHAFFRLNNLKDIDAREEDQAALSKDTQAPQQLRESELDSQTNGRRNSARVPPSVQRSSSLKSQSKFKTTACQTGDYMMLADPAETEQGQKEKGLFSNGKTASGSSHCLKLKFDGAKRTSISNRSTCENCSRSDDSESQCSKPRSQSATRKRINQGQRRSSNQSYSSSVNSYNNSHGSRRKSGGLDSVDYHHERRSPTDINADSFWRVGTSHGEPLTSAAHYIKRSYRRQSARSLRDYENIIYSDRGNPIILSPPTNNINKVSCYQQSWLQPESAKPSPNNNASNYENTEGMCHSLRLDQRPGNKPIISKDSMTFYEKVQGRDSGTDSPTGQFSPTVTGKQYGTLTGHISDRDYHGHNQTLFYYAVNSSAIDTAI